MKIHNCLKHTIPARNDTIDAVKKGTNAYPVAEEGMFPCGECNFKTAKKDTVKKHRYLKHTVPARYIEIEKGTTAYPAEEERMFLCGECNYKTAKKDTFNKHRYLKHTVPARKAMKNADEKTIKREGLRVPIYEDEMHPTYITDYLKSELNEPGNDFLNREDDDGPAEFDDNLNEEIKNLGRDI